MLNAKRKEWFVIKRYIALILCLVLALSSLSLSRIEQCYFIKKTVNRNYKEFEFDYKSQAVNKKDIPKEVPTALVYKALPEQSNTYYPVFSYDSEIFNDFKAYVNDFTWNKLTTRWNVVYADISELNKDKDNIILGITSPKQRVITVNNLVDISTPDKNTKYYKVIYHELGHMVDYTYSVTSCDEELETLYNKALTEHPEWHDYYLMTSKTEFFATWFYYYFVIADKDWADYKSMYPEYLALIDKYLENHR